eukprot:11427547-Alexandrium_andersonii.AAC.1
MPRAKAACRGVRATSAFQNTAFACCVPSVLRAWRPRCTAPKPWNRRHPPIPSAGQGRFALRACWGPQP